MKQEMKTKGKMFCPRCRSFNVKVEINASLALGAPQIWMCVDCGYSNYIFPELNEEKMENGKVEEVKKAWGKEIWMANNKLYCGKKLIFEKREKG